jgi:hypothetical protein
VNLALDIDVFRNLTMIGMAEALFVHRIDQNSGAAIDTRIRDSFVKQDPNTAAYIYTGDWKEISSGVDKVSYQWSECGDKLGCKAGKIRECKEARNSAKTLDVFTRAVDPVIHLIPEGSHATLQAISAKISKITGKNKEFKPDILHRDLSHLWSLNDKARNTASALDYMVVEASLDIYRQQQEYEKATGISGELPYVTSLGQSRSKV